MASIYLIGSLRNPEIPTIASSLRAEGYDVFDDWFAAGSIADDSWRDYSKAKGQTYKEALKDYAANHVYQFDLHHINRCDIGVLVLPAGKSGHLELGYLLGQGKKGYIVADPNVERWDVMYLFATAVVYTYEELVSVLKVG